MRTAASLLICFGFFFSCNAAAQTASPRTAEYCGDCHRAIYEGWKKSAHAAAMESRLFQDAEKAAEADYGSSSRKVCLGCHSPAGVATGDLGLVRKVSWEGITCDYCHSIRDVNMAGANPAARVEFTNVKSGPSKEAVSPAHGTVFSAVHVSSAICATCHEYHNATGFAVLTTYSEWKNSSYQKEGKQCQSCHMFTVHGEIVDARAVRTKERSDEVNLHEMPGSHSAQQLNRAIKTQFSTEHEGEQVKVTVKLTNAGAGHYVPTGSPMRQLILEVLLSPYDGGQTQRQERVYARSVVDEKGQPVRREPAAFLKAAKAVADTRIAPQETRTEAFSFALERGKRAKAEVNLYYYYSPMLTAEEQQRVRFFTVSRMVQ